MEFAIVTVAETFGVIAVCNPVCRTYVAFSGEIVAHLIYIAEFTDLFPYIIICGIG